jgi:hypothetical protein
LDEKQLALCMGSGGLHAAARAMRHPVMALTAPPRRGTFAVMDGRKSKLARGSLVASLAIAIALLTPAAAFAKPAPFYPIGTGANCTGPSDTSGDTFGQATVNVKRATVRVRLAGVSPFSTFSLQADQATTGGGCVTTGSFGFVETDARGNGSTTFALASLLPNATAVTVRASGTTTYITTPIPL